MNYFRVYRLKQLLKLFLFLFAITILLMLSKQNFESTSLCIMTFLYSVAPSLFPFIFFTEFILNTDIINILSKCIGRIIEKIFGTSKNSTIAIIIGFLCGFPMGAKTVSSLYANNFITKKEATKLLAFVNNNNPIFIISTIGIAMFQSITIGIILLISHYTASIIIGISLNIIESTSIIHKKSENLNSFDKKTLKTANSFEKKYSNISFFDLIRKSILNTFVTLGTILGFIIIFNLLFNICKILLNQINVSPTVTSFISGIFEVTLGTKNIATLNIEIESKVIIASFLLGFSGLCILSQIYSTVYMHKFKFKNILIPKIFHGLISGIITFLLIFNFDFNLEATTSVFNNASINMKYDKFFENLKTAYIDSTLLIVAILCIFAIINILVKKENNKDYNSKIILNKKNSSLNGK